MLRYTPLMVALLMIAPVTALPVASAVPPWQPVLDLLAGLGYPHSALLAPQRELTNDNLRVNDKYQATKDIVLVLELAAIRYPVATWNNAREGAVCAYTVDGAQAIVACADATAEETVLATYDLARRASTYPVDAVILLTS